MRLKSQSLLHQVIYSVTPEEAGANLEAALSQSLLHQVIYSVQSPIHIFARQHLVAIPSSSGHLFRLLQQNRICGRIFGSQSLLHQVIYSVRSRVIQGAVRKGKVAIPSSSGHLFRPRHDQGQCFQLDRSRNPFFIRSSIPSLCYVTLHYVTLRVAMPSSSGHLFRQTKVGGNDHYKQCRNPFFIRSSIPSRKEMKESLAFFNESQSLLHQVIYSVQTVL